MSDRVVQSVNDTNGKSGQSVQTHQSVWMSHWLRTSYDEATTSGNKKRGRATMDDDLTHGLASSSRSVEGFRMVETKTFEIIDDIVKTNSNIVENSAFKYGHHTDEMPPVTPVECTSGKEIIPRGCHSLGEGTSKNLPKWMKAHLKGKDSISAMPNPFKETSLDSFSWDRTPKKQKHSGIGMFSSQCITSEETETRKSRNDCYSLLGFQNRVHDVGTKRIGTTVDALEGRQGGCSGFSQTTQGLLITEKIDANPSKESDIFKSTRVVSKMSGNVPSDLHRMSPFPGHVKQRKELQPLISSFDSKVKENVGDVKASKVNSKNELSAVTDTMEMDSCRGENLLSGSNSTTSTKVFNMQSNLPPWIQRAASSRSTGCKRPNIEIPDINFPALENSPEDICPISSKTPSSEMAQPKPKTNFSLDDYPNADPGTRWIKRLKMSSNLAKNTSHQKANKFFRRVLESDVISSETTPSMHVSKELELSGKGGDFFSKDKDLIQEPNKNDKGLLLSHAWIQRWLSNRSRISEKNPQTGVVYGQQSAELALKNIEKGQCPSIAAMALMGRALTCFQPCELQKRGSFTVWNTKAF